MAKLRNISIGKNHYLKPNHIFGRSTSNTDTTIDDKRVSQIHATIRFEGHNWSLIDHSRNGTRVNNKRVNSKTGIRIKKNDRIDFLNDDSAPWILEDDSPPTTFLQATGDECDDITLVDVPVQLNKTNPEALIYSINESEWIASVDGDEKILRNGSLLVLNKNKSWQLNIHKSVLCTIDMDAENKKISKNSTFEFCISADEEHTKLKIIYQNISLDLGERIHHYILLTLARKKIEDYQQGIANESQGWLEIDKLLLMLGVDCYYLNTQIYRIKKQIEKSFGLPIDIFERRTGTKSFPGSIRFSGKSVVIHKEGNKENTTWSNRNHETEEV